MKFEISPNFQGGKRIVVYSKQEHSFDMDISLYSDFTLMLGCSYLGLDINLSSMEAVNISGFCPSDTWIKKNFCFPAETWQGTIKIVPVSDLCGGTGIYLFDKSDIYFDENSGWCYVDGKTGFSPEYNIQFCENAVFGLCGDMLVGIWIRPVMI